MHFHETNEGFLKFLPASDMNSRHPAYKILRMYEVTSATHFPQRRNLYGGRTQKLSGFDPRKIKAHLPAWRTSATGQKRTQA
jgi:hypothetical protein